MDPPRQVSVLIYLNSAVPDGVGGTIFPLADAFKNRSSLLPLSIVPSAELEVGIEGDIRDQRDVSIDKSSPSSGPWKQREVETEAQRQERLSLTTMLQSALDGGLEHRDFFRQGTGSALYALGSQGCAEGRALRRKLPGRRLPAF